MTKAAHPHCFYASRPAQLVVVRKASNDDIPLFCSGDIRWRNGKWWYCEAHGAWHAAANPFGGYELVPKMIKVRVGRPTIDFLGGSSAGQFADGLYGPDANAEAEGISPDDVSLMRKIRAANVRKDGSVTITITTEEAFGLHLSASCMVAGAMDNVDPRYDPQGAAEALAEINSGRSVMRKLEAEGVRS